MIILLIHLICVYWTVLWLSNVKSFDNSERAVLICCALVVAIPMAFGRIVYIILEKRDERNG